MMVVAFALMTDFGPALSCHDGIAEQLYQDTYLQHRATVLLSEGLGLGDSNGN